MSKKSPQLRFEGFTDDWEERKLKDVVEKQIKGKAQFKKLAPGEVEYLDTSRLNGGQAILTNGLKDVTLDDILILWDGSKAGTVYHGFEGALGSTLKAYRTSANSKFVYQYLKRHQDNIYNNYRTPNIPHVQKDFLNVFTISVPVSDEQEKIGSFFKELDYTITLHQRKLDLLKEQKKGYLQKMFPKNGEKVPELRFEGFADDWEERKLSDISNVTKLAGFEFTKYVRYQESGKIIALRGLNVKNGKLVLDEVKYIDDSDFSKLNRSKLYKNDILLTYVGTVGELAIVPENDKYYLAPNVARIRLQDHVNSIFVCQMMNDSNFYNRIISPLIDTSSQPALSMENVRKFQLLMPDYQEQEKIGSFFKQLDDTIALHQRKLDLLKEQKKGFLQKMFV